MLKPQILIVGAGIAGLWLFHELKRQGYDTLLLTNEDGIGAGQTLASQGIIHSGLKYAIAGKVNDLAKSISEMPNCWRDALNGKGDVDLTSATINADSQQLMIPPGIAGDLIKIATKKTLGDSVSAGTSPYDGFNGTTLNMGEMVLDIPSVIRALATPYMDSIRIGTPATINADITIYTAAASNETIAKSLCHDDGLKTQHRPLMMGFIKNAPFPLYAHFVGKSDKPIATVTTHKTENGDLVWYLGGQVAERKTTADPQDVYKAMDKAFKTYLPDLDTSQFEYGVLPINRVEGKSKTKNWMPDTPTIHKSNDGKTLYCYPTKLTFAPMLADMVKKQINFAPNHEQSDFTSLPEAHFAKPPWDAVEWKKQ